MRRYPCDSGTVIRQLAPERPAATEFTAGTASPTGMVAAAAAVRGAAVAVSGAILAAGLGLVVWAVTPESGADPATALQGGVVAFASANLMPVMIGGVRFTLPPLLLTLVVAVLLASTARRGRFLPQGRYQEAVSVAVTAVVYGLVVAAVTRGLGPPEAVPAGWVWTAAALALTATAIGMLGHGSAWRAWWQSVANDRLRLGVRGAGIGLAVLIAGGGLALSVALIARFGTAVAISALAAPSWSDGLGMAMLGLVYLPNAMIAGAGYVTGAGFEIGPGTYSPFASATVDLPAVPLLAAAPDQSGRSLIGLALLAVPVLAGVLIARVVSRSLIARFDRILASAVAAVLAGALLGGAAAVARGGVGDGRWATIGAPPLLLAALAAAEVGIVAVAVSALVGGREVPWRVAEVARDQPAGEKVPTSGAAGADGSAADGIAADGIATDDDLTADDAPPGDDVDLFDSDLFKDHPAAEDVETSAEAAGLTTESNEPTDEAVESTRELAPEAVLDEADEEEGDADPAVNSIEVPAPPAGTDDEAAASAEDETRVVVADSAPPTGGLIPQQRRGSEDGLPPSGDSAVAADPVFEDPTAAETDTVTTEQARGNR